MSTEIKGNDLEKKKEVKISPFEEQMDVYLDEIYDNPNSKSVQKNLYVKNFLYYDKALNKFL